MFFILLFFLPIKVFGSDCLELRSAIALHLNHARLVVAEVNKCQGTITKYYLEMIKPIDLISGIRKKDVSLQDKNKEYTLNTLKKLAQITLDFRPKNLILLPSKSLKKLRDHLEYLKEIKRAINCKIVLPDLETESILSFLAAKFKIQNNTNPIMSWTINDSGSFWVIQDEKGEFKTFYDKINPFIFKDMIIEGVLRKNFHSVWSPNPLGPENASKAEKILEIYLKFNLNNFIQEKSRDYKVVGLGNYITDFENQETSNFFLDDMRLDLKQSLEKTDQDLGGEFPEIRITNLILAIKMLEIMGISNFTPLSVNEADGALLFEKFWTSS